MKKSFIKFIIIFLIFPTAHIFSWWDTGHMAVALIAYEGLTEENQKQVDDLISILSLQFPNSGCFCEASCWADDIRDNGCMAFSSWHHSSLFYDPKGLLSEKEAQKMKKDLCGKDAIFAIEECKKSFDSKVASRWSKGTMLRFLIHIVGDIHQPLHCTSLISDDYPKGDWGGNKKWVNFEGCKVSLHSVWDSIFGRGAERLARPLTQEGLAKLSDFVLEIRQKFPKTAFYQEEVNCLDPIVWREESFHLGTEAYSKLKDDCIDEQYLHWGENICKQRIALAGYRLERFLSNMLNASSSLSRP